jgi:hypothetical protein
MDYKVSKQVLTQNIFRHFGNPHKHKLHSGRGTTALPSISDACGLERTETYWNDLKESARIVSNDLTLKSVVLTS